MRTHNMSSQGPVQKIISVQSHMHFNYPNSKPMQDARLIIQSGLENFCLRKLSRLHQVKSTCSRSGSAA